MAIKKAVQPSSSVVGHTFRFILCTYVLLIIGYFIFAVTHTFIYRPISNKVGYFSYNDTIEVLNDKYKKKIILEWCFLILNILIFMFVYYKLYKKYQSLNLHLYKTSAIITFILLFIMSIIILIRSIKLTKKDKQLFIDELRREEERRIQEERRRIQEERRRQQELEEAPLRQAATIISFIITNVNRNIGVIENNRIRELLTSFKILIFIIQGVGEWTIRNVPIVRERFANLIDFISNDEIRDIIIRDTLLTDTAAEVGERIADPHNQQNSKFIECVSRAMREYQNDNYPYSMELLNQIANDIEKVTRQMDITDRNDRNEYLITARDFLSCSTNVTFSSPIDNLAYYGYGNLWSPHSYDPLPHVQKISICELFARVWKIIQEVENKEERIGLIGNFKRILNTELKDNQVCPAGWSRGAVRVFQLMEDATKKKFGLDKCEDISNLPLFGKKLLEEGVKLENKAYNYNVNTFNGFFTNKFDNNNIDYDEFDAKYMQGTEESYNNYINDFVDKNLPEFFRNIFKEYFAKNIDNVDAESAGTIPLSTFVVTFRNAYNIFKSNKYKDMVAGQRDFGADD
jgi:hypothetical protein